jgi:hypothetical protein
MVTMTVARTVYVMQRPETGEIIHIHEGYSPHTSIYDIYTNEELTDYGIGVPHSPKQFMEMMEEEGFRLFGYRELVGLEVAK